jgi:hypothetical protein
MLDCACLAGIIALKHFRRPEVEVIGDEITTVSRISLESCQLILAFLASTLRASASATGHSSHTFLLHLRLLPRHSNASATGSLAPRTTFECRTTICRSQCTKRNVRFPEIGRRSSGSERHPQNYQRGCAESSGSTRIYRE